MGATHTTHEAHTHKAFADIVRHLTAGETTAETTPRHPAAVAITAGLTRIAPGGTTACSGRPEAASLQIADDSPMRHESACLQRGPRRPRTTVCNLQRSPVGDARRVVCNLQTGEFGGRHLVPSVICRRLARGAVRRHHCKLQMRDRRPCRRARLQIADARPIRPGVNCFIATAFASGRLFVERKRRPHDRFGDHAAAEQTDGNAATDDPARPIVNQEGAAD